MGSAERAFGFCVRSWIWRELRGYLEDWIIITKRQLSFLDYRYHMWLGGRGLAVETVRSCVIRHSGLRAKRNGLPQCSQGLCRGVRTYFVGIRRTRGIHDVLRLTKMPRA